MDEENSEVVQFYRHYVQNNQMDREENLVLPDRVADDVRDGEFSFSLSAIKSILQEHYDDLVSFIFCDDLQISVISLRNMKKMSDMCRNSGLFVIGITFRNE